MCDAVSIGLIATGLSATVAGVSASKQAGAQKQALNYQANADQQQRTDAIQRGEITAQNSMRQRAQKLGEQRVALSANGLDITQGSALDVLATTQYLGEADVNAIQSNAAREAWGYQTESGLKKALASQINPALIGTMTAGSSLLTAASSYATGAGKGGGQLKTDQSGTGNNLMKGKVDFSR